MNSMIIKNKNKCNNVNLYNQTHLNAVVARGHPPILHLNIGRRMGEFAVRVRPCALVALELSTHFQLQPARILAAQ